MTWLSYDLTSGAKITDGLADKPEAVEGQGCREEPIGYPDRLHWDAVIPGFADKPGVPVPAANALVLTKLGFQRLFRQAERIAIRNSDDPVIADFRELALIADTIALTDPDVIAGTRYLETVHLIESGRADCILAGAPPAS